MSKPERRYRVGYQSRDNHTKVWLWSDLTMAEVVVLIDMQKPADAAWWIVDEM